MATNLPQGYYNRISVIYIVLYYRKGTDR